MKRVTASMLVLVCTMSVLPGCTDPFAVKQIDADKQEEPITLNTFSSFAGSDGNASVYQTALADWQRETGNKVNDTSAVIEEIVKRRIRTDFSTGAEPDALFYFTGADADSFLDKVVTVADIRKEFPSYAVNMNEDVVPRGTDGTWYAVPANGFWEHLFVNKNVLEASGIGIPGATYKWEQFLADCRRIKDAGYTPIAASFVDVPHYWWEFTIFNHTTPQTHLTIPGDVTDEAGQAWVSGIKDIKELYDRGYFPDNTLSEKDDALQELFYNNEAAFLLDGSWRANTIRSRNSDENEQVDKESIRNFTVVYFPSRGLARKPTDMIGGISMGWYITKKAWNDPDKKTAVVDFIEFMTTDEKVLLFTGMGVHALANAVSLDESNMDALDKDIMKIIKGATSFTSPVQDIIPGDVRNSMFLNISQVLSGKISAEELVNNFIKAYNQ